MEAATIFKGSQNLWNITEKTWSLIGFQFPEKIDLK